MRKQNWDFLKERIRRKEISEMIKKQWEEDPQRMAKILTKFQIEIYGNNTLD